MTTFAACLAALWEEATAWPINRAHGRVCNGLRWESIPAECRSLPGFALAQAESRLEAGAPDQARERDRPGRFRRRLADRKTRATAKPKRAR